MKSKSGWVLLACLSMPFGIGCSSYPIVRGQSQDGIYSGVIVSQPQGSSASEACDQCRDGCEECSNDWKPRHIHKYHVHPPKSFCYPHEPLRYPSPHLPAGMVAYPYYTVRGPTDFFMK